jgi:hypothetical protein
MNENANATEIAWLGEPSEKYYYYVGTKTNDECDYDRNRFITEHKDEAIEVLNSRKESYADGHIKIYKIGTAYLTQMIMRLLKNKDCDIKKMEFWFNETE